MLNKNAEGLVVQQSVSEHPIN